MLHKVHTGVPTKFKGHIIQVIEFPLSSALLVICFKAIFFFVFKIIISPESSCDRDEPTLSNSIGVRWNHVYLILPVL